MFSDGAEMYRDLDNLERPPLRRILRSLFASDTYSPVRLL